MIDIGLVPRNGPATLEWPSCLRHQEKQRFPLGKAYLDLRSFCCYWQGYGEGFKKHALRNSIPLFLSFSALQNYMRIVIMKNWLEITGKFVKL